MKLTKKLEAEILQVMEEYWSSYLKGNLQTWASYLPDHYRNIGTTEEEIWNSKKEIVDYTKRVFDQMVGMAELRDKKTQIIRYDPYIMVHELGDLYVRAEEGWIFYAPLRLSSLLERTTDGWIILHQHGSYPDSKTEEGEAFAFSELKAENKKLRDAIKSRTIELERKNRELEIDAALERVRAVAMGMKTVAELQPVGEIIFTELKALGFSHLRNTEIIINHEKKESITSYYYSDYGVSGIIDVDYNTNPTVKAWAQDLQKADDAFAEVIIPEKEMKTWREYRLSLGYVPDPKLDKAKSIYYYSYSIGLGALSISLFEPISADGKKILKQFRNVFNLAYQRYHDIALAEAQAREAQIEAALERVRSRTMGMQESEELPEVANRMFVEIRSLGIPVWSTAFNIFSRDKRAVNCNVSSEGQLQPSFSLPLTEEKSFKEWYGAIESKDTFFVQELGGKDLKQHYEYLFTLPGVKDAAKPLEDAGIPLPTYQINHICSFEHGFLLFITYEKVPDAHPIFRRFTSVFEQTYTRFLDLQRAEAQALEAQIEAALERVRSRSMAMHQASELQEVIHTVHKELLDLDLSIDGGSFVVINDDVGPDLRCWGSGGTANTSEEVHVPHFDMPFCTNLMKGIKRGPGFFTEEFSQKEKKDYFTKLFKHKPWSDLGSEQKKETLSSSGGYTRSVAVSKHTSILIINHHGRKFTEDENDILKRFARVFEQTYTRFLDLKKAEAQTREAQIELGLERVRARAMAMQKSDELSELVDTVFKELTKLDFALSWCIINITDDNAMKNTLWAANPEIGKPESYQMKLEDYRFHHEFLQAWKERKTNWVFVLEGPEKESYMEYLFTQTEFSRVPEPVQKEMRATKRYVHSFSFSNFGALQTVGDEPLSDANLNILARFGKVFDLTYTRFNDLQKAEAQAREALIEAALERTRTQSMLMQHSDELNNTISVFHAQLQSLGIDSEYSYLWLPDENNSTHLFLAKWSEEKNKKTVFRNREVVYPLDKTEPSIAACYVAWESGEPVHVNTVPPADIEAYFATWPELLGGIEKFKPKHFKNGLYYVDAYMKYGCFGIVIRRQLTDDEKKILGRFTKEFERTYTRFLDLKKAEAQTREAEIQLALERVRARSLAMHQSDELREVVAMLFDQLKQLGYSSFQSVIIIYNENEKSSEYWLSDDEHMTHPVCYHIPYTGHPILRKKFKLWKEGERFIEVRMTPKVKESFDRFAFQESEFKNMPKASIALRKSIKETVFFSNAAMRYGVLEAAGPAPLSDENADVLQRFAKVFEQTYTRFLDLQKAEAQAREAQIEAALEKVRSRSLAMHNSNELEEVATSVFKRLRELNIEMNNASIFLLKENSTEFDVWIGMEEDKKYTTKSICIPATDHPVMAAYNKANINREKLFTGYWKFEEKNKLWSYLFENSDFKFIPEERKKFILNSECYIISLALLKNTGIQLVRYKNRLFSDDENKILQRFAKVFEQAYIRFLDLQKAEAQAREAQIELAVERVRAKALAMHKSEEILGVVVILKDELMALDIPGVAAATIHLEDDDGFVRMWDLSSVVEMEKGFQLTLDVKFRLAETNPDFYVRRVWKNKNKYFVVKQDEKDLFRTVKWLRQYQPEMADEVLKFLAANKIKYLLHPTVKLANGRLSADLLGEIPAEMESILSKMGAAFDLAYKRFLDLQKAEAQAREALIEAALERVRARSMAMHSSHELAEVASLLFQHVRALGIETYTSGFNIWERDHKEMISWMSNPEGSLNPPFRMPIAAYEENRRFYTSWKEKEDLYVDDIVGEDLQRHYIFLRSFPLLDEAFGKAEAAGIKTPDRQVHNIANFFHGNLLFITLQPCPEYHDIFKRFAKVFEQTYIRFLDLQKAEAQAREAQIEAALERVRSRAMAMHHSDELSHVVATVFEELKQLDIMLTRCLIWIFDPETLSARWWMANSEDPKRPESFYIRHHEHSAYQAFVTAWRERNPKWVYDLHGDTKTSWDDFLFTETELTRLPAEVQAGMREPDRVILSASFNNFGALQTAGLEPLSDENLEIVRRFGRVFDMTYTRFHDLKQAESRAREALRQASLDRIRGEIASMRTAEDLNRITPVIWRELETLEVPFIRCGVFIVDEMNEEVQVYLTTPDGKSLGVLNLSFDANEITSHTVDYWRKKQVYKTHWNKEDFVNWTRSMMKLGQVKDAKTYQGSSKPPESLDLHFVPFTQGMLYVGDVSPLTDEKLDLVKTLADAFAIAYARYEDFKNIEEAKNKIEVTLNELKSTQAQLIHSEKMASLGELTAGIAHEIKNPLNFVNNFSEISRELLDEMKTELENNNEEEAAELMEDLKQNLERINQHGKRADSIVKGMLLHSRGSSGEKSLTDINDLLDQYVNLAYHGMRAQNKEFNITIKTDYDDTLEKIEVVPQDISRVFLNIINNACYAAYDRKIKSSEDHFSPTISVSTKNLNGKIEIRIGDNGAGIPAGIKDKIFQPFFTTKPTGEGTGLGLSLSYDIVTKVHGGELKVVTTDGEDLPAKGRDNTGTVFIIYLPIPKS